MSMLSETTRAQIRPEFGRVMSAFVDKAAALRPRLATQKQLLIVSGSCLFALIGLQLLLGKSAYQSYSADIFVVLDALRHLQAGHRIHEDFSSSVGIFYLWPYYLATFIVPLSAMTIIYGNAIVAVVVFGLAVLVAKDRLTPTWGALFCFYVSLISISPRLLIYLYHVSNYYNQALYNRFGWSLFCILTLLLCLPRTSASSRRATLVDSSLCALLLFALFYLKITYFIAGVGLTCIAFYFVPSDLKIRVGATALIVFAVAMLVMELSTGVTLPYLHDLAIAAKVAQPARFSDAFDIVYFCFSDYVIIVGIAAICILANKPTHLLRNAVLVGSAALAGLAVAVFNLKAYEVPLNPVIALITFLLFQGPNQQNRQSALAMTTVVALMFAHPIILDVAGVLRAEVQSSARGPELVWLRTTPLHDLAISEKPNTLLTPSPGPAPSCCTVDTEYYFVVHDGVELLRHHLKQGETALSFTWSNPFPTLLNLPPVEHTLLWWDPIRTFSREVHPDPATLLASANYIMIPKLADPYGPAVLMTDIYGPELRKEFPRSEESRFWTLYAKQ